MSPSDIVWNTLEPGTMAGLLAGALVGVSEVLGLVLGTGQKKNLSAAPYAAMAYGLLGMSGGLGLALVGALLAATFRFEIDPATTYAVCGALLLAGLAVVVGRYRLNRDLFREHLRMFSPRGLLFHAGLLAGGAVLFVLLRLAGGWVAQWLPSITQWQGGVVAFLVVLAIAGGFASAARPSSSVGTAAGIPPSLVDRPNVILIGLDALRADRLGCYGYKEITPRMDALAADGVRHDRTTVQSQRPPSGLQVGSPAEERDHAGPSPERGRLPDGRLCQQHQHRPSLWL
jgi:hypothetical protein